MKIRRALVLAVSLFLPAVLLAADPPGVSDSPDAAAIRTADQEWLRVFAAKDVEKSVAMLAESGSVLAPNAPRATGREAVRALFTAHFALPGFRISWRPLEVGVAKSGDLGYSTGEYQLSFQDPQGKSIPDHGKYVTVWEKQGDGAWRVKLDVFNSDVALPQPVPVR